MLNNNLTVSLTQLAPSASLSPLLKDKFYASLHSEIQGKGPDLLANAFFQTWLQIDRSLSCMQDRSGLL